MSRSNPIEMIGGKPASVVRDNFILDVKRLVKDGGDWIVRCPHCRRQITLDGSQGDPHGEQYQHRAADCDGWLQVHSDAQVEL